MIDLHTHTFWSDGELIPSEHIRRAAVAGYEVIAITDHADASNIEELCRESKRFVDSIHRHQSAITVLSGVELTHVPPSQIRELTEYGRANGLDLIVVHGETIAEPVMEGTNRAAIEAGVDILAHPGLISPEEMEEAVRRGVRIEITSKKGHSLTNGYVAKLAMEKGAWLVLDTDSHTDTDFISETKARKVLIGAGIPETMIETIFQNSRELVKKILARSPRKVA